MSTQCIPRRSMSSWPATTVLTLILAIVPVTTRAESGSTRARLHYDRGSAAYESRDYELAIAEFQKSLLEAERPASYYALGLAGEAAHRADVAVVGFRRYLLLAPMGPVQLHDHASAYVTEYDLRAQRARELEHEKATERDRLQLAQTPVRSATSPLAWAALSLAAVAVASGVAGASLLGHATTLAPDQAGISLDRRLSVIDQVHSEQTAGTVLLSVGGAALAASAACFGVWMYHRRVPSIRSAAVPIIGGALITVGGGF